MSSKLPPQYSFESWPLPLREWVARCLSQMSDANRADAQAELRQAIANAFAEKAIWTTDWASVQLQSLMPKAPPTINSLKRKMNDTPQLSKKAKKAAAQKHANAGLDFGDQAALSRRAERFQREHELERQKSTRGQASLQANNQNAHLLNRISRADSPSVFGTNPDDPEADPNVLDCDKHTIVGTNQELFKDYLRLTSTAVQPPDLTERITRTSNYCAAGGGFGDIWQCLLQIDENQIMVAVKVIRLQDEGVDEKALRRELGMWKRLQHANILPLLGIVRDFGPYISMVSPWLEHGSLTVYLRKHKHLCLSDRLRLLEDITSGLHYLHGVSVVHGDLTSNNVLVNGGNRAVLTDFGLSSKLVGQDHTYLQRSCAQPGAVRYTAPELLCSNEPIQPDTRSDVYSFGCLALQVLSGHMPWADVKKERIIIVKIINGETLQRPAMSQISDAHWHLIQQCLSRLGATPPRPSTSEISTFLRKALQSEVISSTGRSSQSLQDDITPNTPQPTVALETQFSSQSNDMTSPSIREGKKRKIVRFDVESTPPRLLLSSTAWERKEGAYSGTR